MEQATSLKTVTSFSAVSSAQAAPTTASAWVSTVDVGGNMFGKVRAFISEPTLGNADNAVTVTLWALEGTTVIPLKRMVMDTTDDLFEFAELGVCPPSWSFFATVSSISGTSAAVTATVYVQRYTDDA